MKHQDTDLVDRRPGGLRPRTAGIAENVISLEASMFSQEGASDTSVST